jgi:hypothetical protein
VNVAAFPGRAFKCDGAVERVGERPRDVKPEAGALDWACVWAGILQTHGALSVQHPASILDSRTQLEIAVVELEAASRENIAQDWHHGPYRHLAGARRALSRKSHEDLPRA